METPESTNGSSPKVMVVGLDGASLDLIIPWAKDGSLPTFARILASGVFGKLESINPPLTGPAWISFMTGKNPGKHGIYDFITRGKKDYNSVPINGSMRDGDTIWGLLSQAGKRMTIYSVPVTYPPEPVNGCLVTGMLTPPDVTDFTYPPDLVEDLKQAVPGFTLTPEGTVYALGREAELIDSLERFIDMDMDAARFLMKRGEWDFFMMVFKQTDIAMHWLWRMMDESHPWHVQSAPANIKHGLKQCYQRMDKCLCELWNAAGENTILMLMSDHGAGPLTHYMYMNDWLLQQGLIHLKRNPFTLFKALLYRMGLSPISLHRLGLAVGKGPQAALSLRHRKAGLKALLRRIFLSFEDVDWARTAVYSLGNYGQLYINLRGREPQGIVSPGAEYERVVNDLIDRLKQIRHPKTGELVPLKISRRDEQYSGEHIHEAPDVCFLPEDMRINGFGLYQFSSRSWFSPTFDRSGGHRMDGTYMAVGPGIKTGAVVDGARLIDLAPTVLAAMGVPVPEDMDGRVLTESFEDGYFQNLPIQSVPARPSQLQPALELDANQESIIKERLRGLGYMA